MGFKRLLLIVNLVLFAFLLYYMWFAVLPQFSGTEQYENVKRVMIISTVAIVIAVALSSILLATAKEERQELLELGKFNLLQPVRG